MSAPELVDVEVLSPAQVRILELLSRGLTPEMVADATGWSPDAIDQQIRLARTALGAKNAAHAVAQALRRGLIR